MEIIKLKPKTFAPKLPHQIMEMGIRFKIPLHPCKADKTPLIKDWQKQATYDRQTLEKWLRMPNFAYWGMQTDKYFAVDLDGPNYGTIKEEWLNENPVSQQTKKGMHWLFRNPDGIVRNRGRVTGDIDIRGTGGYICVYHTFFNDFVRPSDVFEPPDELLLLCTSKTDPVVKKNLTAKVKKEFGPGKNNSAIISRASSAGARHSLDLAVKDLIDMDEKNKGRPDYDKAKHYKDYLKNFDKKFGTMPLPKIGKSKTTANTSTPEEDKKKAEKCSIELYKKEKIKDTDWGIEDWFEFGDLSILAGEGGSGKTTLAIKLAVLNALKKEFWTQSEKEGKKQVFIPKGDGRKSLYLCFERKPEKGHNKELANGGDGNQIDIVKELKDEHGKLVPLDLENPVHLYAVLTMIRENDYWSVCLDPVVDLILNNQNDNAKVRRQVALLLKETHGLRTIFFGIAHLRKQRQGVSDMGGIRGASELGNMATSVCRAFELKDEAGYILTKLKVNESKVGTRGGIRYKVETLVINDAFKAEGSKEVGKGGIKSLEYIPKSREKLKEDCKEELPEHGNRHDPATIIKFVIDKLKAEEKELDTTIIKNLAKVHGVSSYYLKSKLKWEDLGYKTESKGQGGDRKVFLVPNL